MRRIALFLALILPCCAAVTKTYSNCLVAGGAPGGGNTSNVDLTNGGSTSTPYSIRIGVVYYIGGSGLTVSDSMSNSLTSRENHTSTEPGIWIYEVDNVTGSGLTTYHVSVTGTSVYPAVCIQAFTGGATSSSYDNSSGNQTNGGTSLQASASITPAGSDGWVTFLGIGPGSNSPTVGSGFGSNVTCLAYSAGVNEGICGAWQVSSSSLQPTWSWGTSTQAAMNVEAFKAAGSVATCSPSLAVVGVGVC